MFFVTENVARNSPDGGNNSLGTKFNIQFNLNISQNIYHIANENLLREERTYISYLLLCLFCKHEHSGHF